MEIAFRAAGGGTGKSMDLDEYDLMENPYQQLIVWDPEAEEILGGYRYLLGDEVEFDAEVSLGWQHSSHVQFLPEIPWKTICLPR